ncbi:MAG: spondin domain-containing protein [Gammaproteobacteria bacterium]|nr:spondin domain-containing protein [Gammaproteobacteria bacterium]
MKKLLSILSLSLLFTINANASDDIKQYEVSITNATAHHVFTPTLIATHNKNINLFNIGQVASTGLAHQAENGDPSVILAETQARYGVYDTVIGGFIPGGTSSSFMITAPKRSNLSLTAMLATTNDAFVALNNVKLPKKSVSYYAHVYDAGSEANNEDCAFIPGPPCAASSGNARDTEESEDFITISNGIHGHGSLSAQDLDWNGPAAIVTITRIDD